jgi:two-component system CheB/CheR fusion protein
MPGRKGSGRTAGRRSTAGKKRGQAGTGTSADKKKTGPVGVRKSTAKKKTGQAGTGTSAAGKKAGKAQKTSRPFAAASTPFKTFPIVGIGASAGGLHALEGFFSHMPADPNMAFVVIQHLAPKHKSIMGTLLERRSAIKIRPVEDGLKIEPACVYLNPPDKNVAVVGGVFSLVDQGSPHASNLPIDYFLRSLAEDRGEMAICIILSGTGSDGTLGLRAIKGEGGTAMVQRVDQAEHGSMPRSAIMTGLVDYILPVEAMPAELLRFTSHAFAGAGLKHIGKQGEPEASLRRIFHSIRSATGTDFSEYKRTTTLRRIHRRMAVHQIERLGIMSSFLSENLER